MGAELDIAPAPRPRVVRPSQSSLDQLRREVARTSYKVATLGVPTMEALLPEIARAERATARALKRWLDSVKGSDVYTVWQHHNAQVHLSTAQDALIQLGHIMGKALTRGGMRAAKAAAELTAKEFARFLEVFDQDDDPPKADAGESADAAAPVVFAGALSAADRYVLSVDTDIRRQLAEGLVRAETIAETSLRIAHRKEEVGPLGAMAALMATTMFRRYRYWAERTVVTETQTAANLGVRHTIGQLAEHMPGLWRRWDAAMDGRVCPTCRQLSGQTAPIGQPFYAMGDSFNEAPAHPNCRCRIDAWMPRWNRYLDAIETTN